MDIRAFRSKLRIIRNKGLQINASIAVQESPSSGAVFSHNSKAERPTR